MHSRIKRKKLRRYAVGVNLGSWKLRWTVYHWHRCLSCCQKQLEVSAIDFITSDESKCGGRSSATAGAQLKRHHTANITLELKPAQLDLLKSASDYCCMHGMLTWLTLHSDVPIVTYFASAKMGPDVWTRPVFKQVAVGILLENMSNAIQYRLMLNYFSPFVGRPYYRSRLSHTVSSVCLSVCLWRFVFRQNGWTDLHEIFREGVDWPWDHLITFWVNSEKPRDAAVLISLSATLRENGLFWQNGWTDLHEIFREAVEWPRDDRITFWVNSEKPRYAAILISLSATLRENGWTDLHECTTAFA